MDRDILELRLAEQAIYRQTVEEKNRRIKELEERLRYLTELVNSLAAPRPQLAAESAPRVLRAVPRRWRV